MAIGARPRLVLMADKRTKALDKRHIGHLAKVLRPIVDERFEGKGNRFAKALGVSQSHVSQILRGENGDRGIGLPTLLAIRDYLRGIGKPMTLDEMLDLEPVRGQPAAAPQPAPQRDEALETLARQVQELAAAVLSAESKQPPTPPAPPSNEAAPVTRRRRGAA